MAPKRDPSTLSNYNQIKATAITLDCDIDFENKRLAGLVRLNLEAVTNQGVTHAILDTSYLDVTDIKVGGETAKWEVGAQLKPLGRPLKISLGSSLSKGDTVQVEITYSTTSKCTALQWLTPEQTPNKKYPYMFSQCQAIHARSLLPCQDTPDVKATVSYTLRSKLQVLASGVPKHSAEVGSSSNSSSGITEYRFEQTIPIPSYLIAMASGHLASASIGPRSTVWTGPEEVDGCRWELQGDMEKFMEAAESLVFKYPWGPYNVLILPSSFPYGGMENPIFTFATPTIISRDKQNIDVIAHELSHSWSGNLVSNASWGHFWLNEGWTTYLERRIQTMMHGEAHRDFSSIIGWKALSDSVEQYGVDHDFTKLVVDLENNKDPDDAFSSIPYEKGYTFLSYLESVVGRKKWDQFIPHYFKTWQQRSLDSYEFKDTLESFFKDDSPATQELQKVDWETWLHSPGFPPKPHFDDSLALVCYNLAEKWQNKSHRDFTPSSDDIQGWVANQSVVFLEKLQSSQETSALAAEDVRQLGEAYGYASSFNVELSSRYFQLGLMARETSVYQATADLLGRVGRMKFVRPLFRQLNKVDRELALKTFEKNKDFYHPICRAMVEKDLFKDD